MHPERQSLRLTDGEKTLLQIGGAGGILGAILQVTAGVLGSGGANGASTDAVLQRLASQPPWYLPLGYLCFIFGALLWVAAYVALAAVLRDGAAWALGRLALASIVVGVTLHIVDAAFNVGVMPGLAAAWRNASPDEQTALLRETEGALRLGEGTWAAVIMIFHGLPFILSGLAVALSPRFPAWLGWIGIVGGAASLIAGLGMFFRVPGFPEWVYIPFAIVISVYMVVAGWLLWTDADLSEARQSLQRGAA